MSRYCHTDWAAEHIDGMGWKMAHNLDVHDITNWWQQNVANPWQRNMCDGHHIARVWCWQVPPAMAVTDVGWRWWQWWWTEVHSEQQGRLTCFFLHCRLLVPVGHALSIHFVTGRPPLSFSLCRGLLLLHWLWFWSVDTHSHRSPHTVNT